MPRALSMVLSKDDNPEIYMMDLATRQLTRLTQAVNAAVLNETFFRE